MDNDQVLYVYKCAECGHAGSLHLACDGHDGEQSNCQAYGATAALEWDGGVTFEVAPCPVN